MKNLLYLFSFLLLAFSGCTGKEAASTVSAPEEAEPKPWLTFKGDPDGEKIVLVSGDEEYRSEEALPQLARILSRHHGFNCTVLFAQDPEKPEVVDPNYLSNIPGLENLEDADLMIIFTRFRSLPDSQMQLIDNYLRSGRPVIGIRTATHAFNFEKFPEHNWRHYGNYYQGDKEAWHDGFGRLVMGEHWISHHGHHKHQSTRGIIADGAKDHPVTRGLNDGDIWGPTDVYGVRLPLPGDSQPIVLGQVINRKGAYDENDRLYGMRPDDDEIATVNPADEAVGNPNDPMMPVAWVKTYQIPGGQPGKVFAATIGASTDLLSEGTRRMYVNAVFWAMNKPVPEKADVAIVGKYEPTPYAFHDDEYWEQKNLKLSDILALDNDH